MIELEFVGLGLALYFFMAWLCYSWGYRDAMEKFVVKKQRGKKNENNN